MERQLQNQAKTSSTSKVVPVEQGLFQPRSFTDSEQEAALTLPSSHQSPDLQTKINTAARLGHNFGRVQVQSNTPTVIQPKSLIRQPQEPPQEREANSMAEPVKLMAPLAFGKPIQRESDEDEPIQMKPQWVLQRLPQEVEDEEPLQMKPQLGLLQRQEPEVDSEPIQMKPQFGLLQRQEPEVDSEPIQMKRIQLKGIVGQPGDKYKQEAYTVAAQDDLTAHESTHVVQQAGKSQVQRQPLPAPAPGGFSPTSSAPPPPIPQSESERTISQIHGLWMKEMLERLSALDKKPLEDILNIVDRVRGIDVARTRVAIEAVLGMKFSQSSINWLDKNSSTGGFSAQVIEIRDFMKPAAFDRAASTLLVKVTQQIQQSYKKAIQDSQTNAKDSAKTTSNPALPTEAQKAHEKLKILSPLAAIQLQAVINAQGYLSMSDSKAHDAASKAAGLTSDQEWCGGFAVTNYIPLQLSAQLKGVFWSTPKLLDFFTYQHGYDPYQWIHVGDENPEVKTYHEKRGSLRKWLTGDQIHAGGELDIRPGDIVLQDNRDDSKADHIQMVQSWEPATQTLFTIDGNGGGYQVDNRPIAKANKDKPTPDDEKRKAVETSTGYRLRSGSGGGVVGLGSYNLSAEPTEQEVKKARQNGKKIVRIVGIGRPSLVDFETQRYLTKLPRKGKKP